MKRSLRRRQILRKRRDFDRVRRNGKRINSRLVACNYLEHQDQTDISRMVAFIVPKSCGAAVVRNRIRRRLKEIYRNLQQFLPEGLWSVWIARKESAEASYWQLKDEVEGVYRKANFF
ncbi:MAG: ribonuclease P protein component [Verrucomicrobiota bacterium]